MGRSAMREDVHDQIEQIKDWQITHGSLLKLIRTSNEHTVLSRPIGVSVYPTPFPRGLFDQALALQKAFNLLYASISEDEEWLRQTLGPLEATDPFIQCLWTICDEARRMRKADQKPEDSQQLTLGIFRSDYMLHLPGTVTESSMIDTSAPEPQLKQVEFNTFSVAGGTHGSIAARMHRHLQHRNGQYPQNTLPRNDTIQSIVSGLATAHAAYGESRSGNPLAVLFVVQPENVNICDERPLEYGLWELDPPIEAYRLEFGKPILSKASLGPRGALLFTGPSERVLEISVVYMRAGYDAEEYDDEGMDARLLLERSCAIKCPSILAQLATSKKVQQALAEPGAVERFLPPEDAAAVRKTFAPMYILTPSGNGSLGRRLVEDPEAATRHVLKPSREGGGHNVYGCEIPEFLDSVGEYEWQNFILMELIQPPVVSGTLMSPRGLYRGPVVSELGAFGTILWNRTAEDQNGGVQVLQNNNGGWSFKTKAAHVNEMSVVKGYGCFDCPALE